MQMVHSDGQKRNYVVESGTPIMPGLSIGVTLWMRLGLPRLLHPMTHQTLKRKKAFNSKGFGCFQ